MICICHVIVLPIREVLYVVQKLSIPFAFEHLDVAGLSLCRCRLRAHNLVASLTLSIRTEACQRSDQILDIGYAR